MPLDLPLPVLYLITSGTTTAKTTPDSDEFSNVLRLLKAAVDSQINLFQIREKNLSARVLYELATRAAGLTRGTPTRLLINDRSDIARAAGADGVQLTSQSLPVEVVRQTYGSNFLIGASTHSLEQARAARNAGADFVVFGPVFKTKSKLAFGAPLGPGKLREVADELNEFPVVAIGGITLKKVDECFRAGAKGVAAIRLLNDAGNLPVVIKEIRSWYRADAHQG